MKSILDVSNLSYHIDSKQIVKSVDLSIQAGDVVALLGGNGAGKSTIIDLITSNIKPSTGKIHYFGKSTFDKVKHRMGVAFDDVTTFSPLLKVKEHVKFVQGIYKVPDKQITHYKDLLSLEKIWDSGIKDLSKGELKKVSLFTALFHEPEFVILDEPTSFLDPFIRKKLWEDLISKDVSILFTSHLWGEVEENADQLIFLHEGEVLATISMTQAMSDDLLPGQKKVTVPFSSHFKVPEDNAFVYDSEIHLFGSIDNLLQAYDLQNYSILDKSLKDIYQYLIYKNQKNESNTAVLSI